MVQRYRYVIFHKPYGVLCQFTPTASNAPTLKDYIPVPHVYPVGRLDQDSEGLLLLTNDGKLQHRLTDPQFHHPKTYWVQVEGIPQPQQLQQLRQGVTINLKGKPYHTLPAQVEVIEVNIPDRVPPIRYRAHIPTTWLQMTIREGKNRQIRRMTAQVGLPTLRLVRVKIGNLTLGELAPGQWRELSPTQALSLAYVKITNR